MIKKIKTSFKNLQEISKNLVYLFATVKIWVVIRSIFVNIFIYQITTNLQDLILFNIWYNIIMSWSVIITSYFAQKFWINLKTILKFPYIFYILSILIFIYSQTTFFVILAIYVMEFGRWIFRWWFQPYHLNKTEKKSKEFYSGMLSSFNVIVWLIVPFISAIILVSVPESVINPYFLVLWLWPVSYLFTYPIINKLPDYIPVSNPEKKFKFKKLFTESKIYGHIYLAFAALRPVEQLVLYMSWFAVLKTWANLWFYETIIWIISVFITSLLWLRQNSKNIIKITWIITLGMFITHMILFFNLNFIWYTIFSLLIIIFKPLFHTTTISITMDIAERFNRDFNELTIIIIREFLTIIWRILLLTVMLFMVWDKTELSWMLKPWIIILSLTPIIIWLTIIKYNKQYKKIN